MFTKKLSHIILASTMILTVGTSFMATGTPAEAATVISQTAYETVMGFSAEELTAATGMELTSATIQKTYNKLKGKAIWETLGYSATKASKVAQRISLSKNQTLGILSDMIANPGLNFKVVYISSPGYEGVNIGSVNLTPPTGEEPTDLEQPATGLDSMIKEIEIEVDYKAKNQDIDLDFEVKSNGKVKATYENEGTREDLEGDAATAVAANLLSGLDLKNMSDAQIAEHVITKLGANKNFKKFAFKVKYVDKTKVDFKIK